MAWWWLLIGLALAPTDAPAPACAGCHREVARSHGESLHAAAWSNAVFQAEYREHPKPWCVSCHAPEVAAGQRGDPPIEAARRGVSCATCHLAPGDRVRARRRRPGSIHRTAVDPSFGGPDDCGRCHQFNFPVLDGAGRLAAYTREPMQNTVAEVRRHLGARAACLGCHAAGGDHRFPGSHDPEMLRRALDASLCRRGERVELRFGNVGAAHRVPSGGVNRFIVARLWRASAPERLRQLRLGRRFASEPGGGKRTALDTTLAPGAWRRLAARPEELGGDPAEPISAELKYVYTLSERAALPGGAPNHATIFRFRERVERLEGCSD